jgi:hypothetical protein
MNMNSTEKNLKDMSTVLELQRRVAEVAEENRKKVTELQAKFEKVQNLAFDECPVCYKDISVKNTCCMSNCDHKMCKSCYYNWLDTQEKNTCPMCREEVFKNNEDIITKRSSLQLHLDSLESEVSEMYHERRTIVHSLKKKKSKFHQLEDEIYNKQQIVAEMNEYKRNPEKWKKKMEKRKRKEILKGKKVWKEHMKTITKEIIWEYESRMSDAKNSSIAACDHRELKRLRKSPGWLTAWKLVGGFPTYIYKDNDPVDLSTTNMFEEDETGYTTPPGVDTRLMGPLYPDMPGLSPFSDDELEDMALNETPFSQDELDTIQLRNSLFQSQLEEGEIREDASVIIPHLIRHNSDYYNIYVNSLGDNYINDRRHFQQTDDSYRPTNRINRELTYPVNEVRRLQETFVGGAIPFVHAHDLMGEERRRAENE